MILLHILNPKPLEGVGGEWHLNIYLHRKKIKFQDLAICRTQLSITKSTVGKGLYLAQIGEPRLHRGRGGGVATQPSVLSFREKRSMHNHNHAESTRWRYKGLCKIKVCTHHVSSKIKLLQNKKKTKNHNKIRYSLYCCH
jgi:hypothetical protein